MSMWRWTKIRKANIPPDVRKIFEGYGEAMVSMVMAIRKQEDYGDLNKYWPEAVLWLRERQDVHARREDRLETVEWAILIFAVVASIAAILQIVTWFMPGSGR